MELLDDLRDRIFNHYLIFIQEILREERGITEDRREKLSNLNDWTFKERLFWTKQRAVTGPFLLSRNRAILRHIFSLIFRGSSTLLSYSFMTCLTFTLFCKLLMTKTNDCGV